MLVDDERLVRSALTQALSDAGIDVIGEAASGDDALELVLDLRPDVVTMDPNLPGTSGEDVIRRLAVLAPTSPVLVLTRSDQNKVVEAIIAGASGYILKSAPAEAIISAVRATAAGESVISSQIAGKLLERIRELDIPTTATRPTAASAIRASLTPRELDIFRMLASGESNQEIGRQLALSTNTVRNHIKSILAKLQLENRIQAAVEAVRAGIS